MTKLISIQFQNFQLYGNIPTKIDLTTPGVTMITGTNGTGKSSIINAISYALYDKPISNISKDGLINNINNKNMEVIIEFEKNNHLYKVRRYRKMKGNGVELWEDNKNITPDSTNNTTSLLEKIIDMPYDLFVRVIVFSAINTQFLNLPMRQQADMLEELLDLQMLSNKSDVLKERIKDTTRSLETEEEHIIQSNKDCNKFATQLQRAVSRVEEWDKEHNSYIEQLTSELKELNKVDIKNEQKLQEINLKLNTDITNRTHEIKEISILLDKEIELEEQLKEYIESEKNWDKEQVEKINNVETKLIELKEISKDNKKQIKFINDLEILNEEKDDITKTKNELNVEIYTLTKIISDTQNELDILAHNNCPYCQQEFKDTKDKVTECKKIIVDNTKKLSLHNKKIKQLDIQLKEINPKLEKLKKDINITLDEILEIDNTISTLNERLTTYKDVTNIYSDNVTNIKKKIIPNLKSKLDKLLTKLNTKHKTLQEDLTKISSQRKLQDNEITQHNQQLAVLNSKIDQAKKEVNNMLEPLQELENELFDEKENITFLNVFKQSGLNIEDYTTMFDTINAENSYVFIKGTKLNDELHKLLEHQKFLLKLLTNKNSFIRKTMLNQTIPFLNKQLDNYLKIMGLPHSIVFTPKMEVDISMLGNTLQYGNLSNGQACRVNLALSFAFRDLLQYLHDPINVLILDEILDVGLDDEGVQNAVKMVKRKSVDDKASIFVISHINDIDNTFHNKINVSLQDGFSTITN